MTANRRTQLEKLIRRIRSDARLFEDDATAARLSAILRKAKARLMPLWEAEAYDRKDAEFKRRYAADVAINYHSAGA